MLTNFSEKEQRLQARRLLQEGMRKTMVDLYAGQMIAAAQELMMEPHQLMVLASVG